MKGFDISKWQGPAFDFDGAKSAGYDFCFVRTGDGLRIDPYAVSNIKASAEAGLIAGVYHFSRATTTQSALNEASIVNSCLLSAETGSQESVMVALDMEVYKDKVLHQSVFGAFMGEIKRVFPNAVPYLYTSMYNFNNYFDKEWFALNAKLWIARYNTVAPQVGCEVDVWQYTSDADPSDFYRGALDRNIMFDYAYEDTPAPLEPDNVQLSTSEIVLKVFQNVYGVGEARRKALTEQGFNPDDIQAAVNEYYKTALDCIAGKYGNNPKRRENIQKLGLDPDVNQQIVNILLGK